jgi:hypothetical protein
MLLQFSMLLKHHNCSYSSLSSRWSAVQYCLIIENNEPDIKVSIIKATCRELAPQNSILPCQGREGFDLLIRHSHRQRLDFRPVSIFVFDSFTLGMTREEPYGLTCIRPYEILAVDLCPLQSAKLGKISLNMPCFMVFRAFIQLLSYKCIDGL